MALAFIIVTTSNSKQNPYALFDGIVGRSDIAEYRDSAYTDLMLAGANGIREIHAGIDAAKQGWLKTVAVCVVLMDRQGEPEIRKALLKHQSERFNKTLENEPGRLLDPVHVVVALNKILEGSSDKEISGSAKTRLKKAVEYIQKLGKTLDDRLARLGEFKSFNDLQKAIKSDEGGAVTVSEAAINVVDATAKFKARAGSYYVERAPVYGAFEIDPAVGIMQHNGLWVAVCRAKGDTFEVVGLNRHREIVSAVVNDTASRDTLLKNEIAAEESATLEGEAA